MVYKINYFIFTITKRTDKSAQVGSLKATKFQNNLKFKTIQTMEDKAINQKESLDLISEMIRKTRNQPSTRKDFDAFLLYGYSAVAIAVMAWLAIRLTGNMRFMLIWFAMFLPYLWMSLTGKSRKPEVTTYLDSMLANVWKVIGSMFGLTVVAIAAIGALIGHIDFSLMMPLSIIYGGIGTSMTGLVIKEKWFVWPPLAGLLVAIYMFITGTCDNSWNLLFGASFLYFMVIPAHVVRAKIQ